MPLLEIEISSIVNIKATSKKKNSNDNENTEELIEPDIVDKPYVTESPNNNTGSKKYDVILGKKYIADAKASGKNKVECHIVDIEYLSVNSIDESKFQSYPAINTDQFTKELEALRNTQILPPVIIVQADNKNILASGIRRLRLAKAADLKNLPTLVLPLTDEQIDKSIKLEFLHEFGEYGVLKHPTVQADYQQLKQQLIPKPKYHDSLENEVTWLSQVRDWVFQNLQELITQQITIEKQSKFSMVLQQNIFKHSKFFQLVIELTNLISPEDFLISNFNQVGDKISSCLVAILAEVLKNLPSVAESVLPQLFKGSRSIIFEFVNQALEDEINNSRWFLSKADLQNQLTAFLLKNDFIYKKPADKRDTLKKDKLKQANKFYTLDLFDIDIISEGIIAPILRAIENNPNIKCHELIDIREIEIGVRKNISNKFYKQLDRELVFFQGRIFDKFSENIGACTVAEIGKIFDKYVIMANLFKLIIIDYEKFRDKDKIQIFFINICVDYLASLQTPNNIAKQLLIDLKNTFEVNTGINKKLSEQFKALMLSKRTTAIPEYVHLSSNFCYPGLDTTSKVIAALRLTECSNKRYLKEKALEKDILFKPRVSFAVLRKIVDKNQKEGRAKYPDIVDSSDGLTTFMRSYPFVFSGMITEKINISCNGLTTTHNPQLETYKAEYECLMKTTSAGLTEKQRPADNQIAAWMLNITQGKIIAKLSEYIGTKRQCTIIDYLKTLTFCLFFTEVIRNPAASVTHAVILIKIAEESLPENIKMPLQYALTEEGFSMTPAQSTPAAKISQNRLVPKCQFFTQPEKNSYFMKKHAIKILGSNSLALENRELKTTEKMDFKKLAEAACSVYNLKSEMALKF